MATTSYMVLDLPVVGSTPGPEWASKINAALRDKIDPHDHSPGKGVPVRTSGLYVDAGLDLGGYDATGLRSARLTNHAAPLAGAADLGCLFVSGGELYYRDGAGNAIQLSAGGALNAASLGAIGGDYTTSGASLAYASVSKLFSFESSAGVKAHAALGNLSIYEAVASGKGVTLRAPTGLAANYQLTLPSALPASTRLLSLDSSGNIAATAYTAANVARLNEAQTWTAKPTLSAGVDVTGNVTATGKGLFASLDLTGNGGAYAGDGQVYAASVELVSGTAFIDFKDVASEDLDARIIKATGANLEVVGTPLTVPTPVAATDAATKGYVDGRTIAKVLFSGGTALQDLNTSVTLTHNLGTGLYRAFVTVTTFTAGAPAGATRVRSVGKGPNTLTVTAEDAPGSGRIVLFDVLLFESS